MRQMVNENLSCLIGDGQSVAVLFSGGTDSTCLLLSLLELGFNPPLYTYVVKGFDSADLQRAQVMSDLHNLPLVVCTVPSDVDSLIRDVRQIIADGVQGKVYIQCMHGHYYVAPKVREDVVVNGSGVDGPCGAYRNLAVIGNWKDQRLFDEARQKHLDNPNDDAMIDQAKCYAQHGVQVIYPYRMKNIIECLMPLSWQQINRPKRKWIILRDYWPEIPARYFRPRGSQQLVAGTRDLHDKLLRTPLNRMGRKRVDEIYKDIAAGRV